MLLALFIAGWIAVDAAALPAVPKPTSDHVQIMSDGEPWDDPEEHRFGVGALREEVPSTGRRLIPAADDTEMSQSNER